MCRTPIRARILLVAVTTALAQLSCARADQRIDRGAAVQSYAVEVVRTYGDSVPPDPRDSVVHGGGALSRILAVREDAGGAVYALDSDYKKVAVYSADGRFTRVIGAGYGEGPGEFRLPTAFDVTPTGGVAVYDYSLQRVTFFDAAGQYDRLVNVARSWKDMLVLDSTLLASRFATRAVLVEAASATTGEAIGPELTPPSGELDFSPDGLVARLGRSASGSPLVADHRPSTWYTRSAEGWTRIGGHAIANTPPREVRGTLREGGHAIGIGGLSDGTVLVAYRRNFDSPTYGDSGIFVDVYAADRSYLGSARLPATRVNAFTTSRDSAEFLIGVDEPYPHVVRLRLQRSAATP